MSNSRKKFPIWIPITSLILASVLNPEAIQMLIVGIAVDLALTEIFGAFLVYCFILYIGHIIFISTKK